MCGLPAVCPVPHRSVWSKGVSKRLPVSSLLYPSRTKLLMENWTPLQFLALCRLNNPFHLLFIPLAPLTWAVILLWRDAECWSCAYRGYGGLSEESSCALCRSNVAQQKPKTLSLFPTVYWKFYHAPGNLWHAMSSQGCFNMQRYDTSSLPWHCFNVIADLRVFTKI